MNVEICYNEQEQLTLWSMQKLRDDYLESLVSRYLDGGESEQEVRDARETALNDVHLSELDAAIAKFQGAMVPMYFKTDAEPVKPNLETIHPVSKTEKTNIEAALRIGQFYGYGNLIAHLGTCWVRELVAQNVDEETARKHVKNASEPYEIYFQDHLLGNNNDDEEK